MNPPRYPPPMTRHHLLTVRVSAAERDALEAVRTAMDAARGDVRRLTLAEAIRALPAVWSLLSPEQQRVAASELV